MSCWPPPVQLPLPSLWHNVHFYTRSTPSALVGPGSRRLAIMMTGEQPGLHLSVLLRPPVREKQSTKQPLLQTRRLQKEPDIRNGAFISGVPRQGVFRAEPVLERLSATTSLRESIRGGLVKVNQSLARVILLPEIQRWQACSVWGRRFYLVNDHAIHRSLLGFQLQAKLFLNSSEKRRAARTRVTHRRTSILRRPR